MRAYIAILSSLVVFLSSTLAGACEKSIVAKHRHHLKKAPILGHKSAHLKSKLSSRKIAHHKINKRSHRVQHNRVTELPAKYARGEKMRDFDSKGDLASIHRQPTNETDGYPAPDVLSTIQPAHGPSQDLEVDF